MFSRKILLGLLAFSSATAFAGVGNIPEFVEPDHGALALEPDLVMTNGAGVGIDSKYSFGLTDFMDGQAILGFGQGPRRFRVGGNLGFDIFPDVDKQPGIGIAAQLLYVVLPNDSQVELTGIPYIHKSFPQADGKSIDPFFAFPAGLAFRSGTYEAIETAVVGTLVKESERLTYSVELGVNVDHSDTYMSAGIIYTY